MKIVFECIGFATNPCFIVDKQLDRPLPYGTIVDRSDNLEFWPENHDPNFVSETQVKEAYKAAKQKYTVCVNDVSKEAWLEGCFGELKGK